MGGGECFIHSTLCTARALDLGTQLLSEIVIGIVVFPIVLEKLVILDFGSRIFPTGSLKLLYCCDDNAND